MVIPENKALTMILLFIIVALGLSTAVCANTPLPGAVVVADSSRLEYNEYVDSIFYARLAAEQLADSTLADRQTFLFLNGMKCAMTGNLSNAMQCFLQTIEIDSDMKNKELCAAASFQIYRILYSNKEYEQAYICLTKAHDLVPANTTYLENLAWFDYSIDNYKQARKHYAKLTKTDPFNAQYIHILSKIYTETGKYKQAVRELDKLEKLEGNSLRLVVDRASIYHQLGNNAKAAAEYTAYATHHPDEHLEAMLYLCQFYDSTNEHNKLYDTLLALLEQYPNNSTVHLSLTDYYKEFGPDSLYQKHIVEAIAAQTVPANVLVPYVRTALASSIQKNDTGSIATTVGLLDSKYSDNPLALSLIADTYQAVADTTRWLNTLYRISSVAADETNDLKIIELEQSRNNFDSIISLTAQGLKRYDTDRWRFFHIISFGNQERYDTMTATAQRLLPSITDNHIKSSVYQILGDIYYSEQNDSIAVAMYDSCLLYNPKNSGALNNLAYNITKQDNPDLKKAEKYATKALEIDPESTTILDTYAWILFLRSDYMLSKIYFDKLVRIEQDNNLATSTEVLYHRGMLSIKLGDDETARRLFEEALALHKKEYTDKNKTISEPDIIDFMVKWLSENR